MFQLASDYVFTHHEVLGWGEGCGSTNDGVCLPQPVWDSKKHPSFFSKMKNNALSENLISPNEALNQLTSTLEYFNLFLILG